MPTFNKGIVHGQLSNEQITLKSLLPSCAKYAMPEAIQRKKTERRKEINQKKNGRQKQTNEGI